MGIVIVPVVLLAPTNNCQFTATNQIVRGGSLTPLIRNGATITLQEGYYKCNAIKREDVVELLIGGRKIIKIVKGLPGDVIALSQSHDGWNILINGSVVKNSQGVSYVINDYHARMLSLYIKEYNGIIPDGAYLVLGNQPQGTIDSTQFGLVSNADIIGKVIY